MKYVFMAKKFIVIQIGESEEAVDDNPESSSDFSNLLPDWCAS